MPYGRNTSDTERLALLAQLQELFGVKQGYPYQNYSNGMNSFGMNSFSPTSSPYSQKNNLLDRLKEFMGNYNNMQYNNGSSY